jgi:hypothetical protein
MKVCYTLRGSHQPAKRTSIDHWNDRFAAQSLSDFAGLITVAEMALHALEIEAPETPHMLNLLSVSISHLLTRGATKQEKMLLDAQVQGLLKRLCATKWPAAQIKALLSSLRSAHMTEDLTATVLAAAHVACASLKRADDKHLADAVQSMLALPSAVTCQHLKSVCKLMTDRSRQDSNNDASMHSAEAAVLGKVVGVLARDKRLANAWIKSCRSDECHSQFSMSLLIMLVSVNRSSSAALEALKGLISSALASEEELQASKWLSLPSCKQPASARSLAVLLHGVSKSQNVDLVTQLLQLARHLLASGKGKTTSISAFQHVESEDYTGLQWWGAPIGASSLHAAGAALLEQVLASARNCSGARILKSVNALRDLLNSRSC